MTEQKRNHTTQVWKGIGITGLLHLLLLLFPPAFIVIGVVQLVYMIPAMLIYGKKDEGILQGMYIGMGVTFLLNAACFGFVLVQFNGL